MGITSLTCFCGLDVAEKVVWEFFNCLSAATMNWIRQAITFIEIQNRGTFIKTSFKSQSPGPGCQEVFYNRQPVKWKIKIYAFHWEGTDLNSKCAVYCMRWERKMHIHPHSRPFRDINIRLDVGERGLKWAWLFKMKTFFTPETCYY